MYKLLQVALAVSFAVSFNVLQQAPAFAQAAPPALTGPTEVGTTTMTAGQYQVTDKANGKVYDLMVTGKGSMILSPSSSVAAVSAPTAAAAAAVGASAPVANPTAATSAAASTAAPATAAAAPAGASSAINNLVNQGMQRGMTELMKRGATNQLKNLVK